eukprot:XP_011662296.1 PREDICTED: retinol dehydrogenase 8 [Strongylocentrotus purpuratus]
MAPQIVLMTGCSSGIGLAMVQRLARDPDQRFIIIATVIAMSEKNDLEAAVKDDLGSKVFIKELDITKDENITEVVADVIKNHGRIDVLLNIAGVAFYGVPERITRKQIDLSFNVNVIGPIILTQAVLPHMKEKHSGKIITFSSVAGRIGCPYSEVYNASKFAVDGFFEALAAGLRAFNIRVCLIEPRQVDTGFWGGVLKQIEAGANDETITEIDRRQLRNRHANIQVSTILKVVEVVDVVMTKCLDVDEPVLRQMIDGESGENLHKNRRGVDGRSWTGCFRTRFNCRH